MISSCLTPKYVNMCMSSHTYFYLKYSWDANQALIGHCGTGADSQVLIIASCVP